MRFPTAWTKDRLLTVSAIFLLAAVRLMAAPTGPTLQFGYDQARPLDNPLSQFMYFVPLISPEHVALSTNAGNTQCARVTSCHCHTNGATFQAECEFSFIGDGLQRNVFDHTVIIKRRHKDLDSGKGLLHQLEAISVEGSGCGIIEVDGVWTNGQAVVTEMRIKFDAHGHASPVSVDLQDIVLHHGALHYENEMVARVNMLTFQQKSDPPKMEVTLASVKRKDAGDGIWANFIGDLKGEAANLLLPPLTITVDGHQAMLNFGLALAMQKASFTFPFASRLTNGPAIGM